MSDRVDDLRRRASIMALGGGGNPEPEPRRYVNHDYKPGRFGGGCQVILARYPCPYPREEHRDAVPESEPTFPETGLGPYLTEYQRVVRELAAQTAIPPITKENPMKQSDLTLVSGPLLFGFGGKLAAGKDTAADHLVAHRGFTKLGMSEPLHEALLALNPIISGQFRYADVVAEVGYVEAKRNPEVRALLQRLGTEVGRKLIDENVWVDMAGRRIDKLRSEGHPVAITGIRYRNELALIRDRGGILVWVERDGLAGTTTGHASESSLTYEDFDVVVHNDDTVETLTFRTDTVLEWARKAANR